jgi:hypothetical protein
LPLCPVFKGAKKRTKEKAGCSLVPLSAEYPALLVKKGRCGKSLKLRRNAIPFFTALLGCVKWPFKNLYPYTFFIKNKCI